MKPNRTRELASILRFLALCLPLALSFGCMRRHSIEAGSWRLQLKASQPGSQSERYVTPIKDVQLTVQWGKEKGTELIKIQYLKPAPEESSEQKDELEEESAPVAMAGEIQNGEVKLLGADAHWNLQLRGKVLNPSTMQGTAFARGRHAGQDKYYFDGTWRMVKTKKVD